MKYSTRLCESIRSLRHEMISMAFSSRLWETDATRPLMADASPYSDRDPTSAEGSRCSLSDEDASSFDSTGMYYFTSSRTIEEALLVRR